MSSKTVELVQRAERGARVANVREALALTGEEFAKRLNAAAKARGLRATYDKGKVSRMESGSRKLTAEEIAIVATLDPKERGVDWLVFGDVPAEEKRPSRPLKDGTSGGTPLPHPRKRPKTGTD